MLVEQTSVVDPQRLGRSAGCLDAGELRAVDEALGLILGLWRSLQDHSITGEAATSTGASMLALWLQCAARARSPA